MRRREASYVAFLSALVLSAGCGQAPQEGSVRAGATPRLGPRTATEPAASPHPRTLILPAGSLPLRRLVENAKSESTEYATDTVRVVALLVTTTHDAVVRAGDGPSGGFPDVPTLMVTVASDFAIGAPVAHPIVFHSAYDVMEIDPATGAVQGFVLAKKVDLAGALRIGSSSESAG